MNNMKNLGKDIKTVLITKEQIEKRVEELGRQITKDYEGKDVVLVGILKGAMPFLCDLMRSIDLPVTLDTMCVSSYGNSTVSSGHVNIKKDLDRDIRGKNVIVVEDIIDTGITMSALVPLLKQRGAASVELAICLNKKERREKEVDVKYVGFDIPDEFIVGYGCDYAENTEICRTYASWTAGCIPKRKYLDVPFRSIRARTVRRWLALWA